MSAQTSTASGPVLSSFATWDGSSGESEAGVNDIPSDTLFTALNENHVTYKHLLVLLVQSAVGVLIMLLNGLVLDTMVRQGKSREAADLLVAGLALSDALVGVMVLWVSVYNIVYFQVMEECLLRLGLAHSTMAISAFLLLCLTVDRFMKIILPYKYIDVCKKWTVWVVLVGVWLLGIVLGSLPLFGWNSAETPTSSGDPLCGYFKIMNPDYLRMYSVVICAPICIIFLLYMKLFLVARKHAVAIATSQGTGAPRASSDHGHVWRYTKTVFIIVGVYLICWLPLGLVVICSITGVLNGMSITRRGDLMLYTGIFVFFNSLMNPIIYAKKIPAIRRRFTAIFCRCRKKTEDNSEQIFSVTNTKSNIN